jgi:anti-sigma B factor antagonist
MNGPQKKKELEVQQAGDVTVVSFTRTKILDEQVIQAIGDQLFELVEKQGKNKLLINFSKVEYLSSAALGKLISLNSRIAKAKGKLALCCMDPSIYEVFKITQLERIFKNYADEGEALQSFA